LMQLAAWRVGCVGPPFFDFAVIIPFPNLSDGLFL